MESSTAASPGHTAAPPQAPADGTGAPDVGLLRVLQDDGSVRPVSDPAIPADLPLRAYRAMRLVRLLDERMIRLQRQGRIGFYGASTGQEATPIGTALAIREGDWVFPALRESSMMLVRGLPLATYLAQIFGSGADLLKGRMQPSHMSARQVRQVSWSSCIGTQLPHAIGAAWAAKLREDDAVTVGFVGDGGTSEPDFHNALNFAGVYRVPCVLICQNNQFAISTRPWHQTASQTFAVKGRAYGVTSVRIDGNDVLAVYHAVARAAARARRGEGPTFIEAVTYRVGAHSTSDDPSCYRTQEEVDAWLKRDPLQALRRHLERMELVDDDSDAQLDEALNAEISAAIEEAESQPPPSRETLFDDVYAELPWHLREQRELMLSLPKTPRHGGAR